MFANIDLFLSAFTGRLQTARFSRSEEILHTWKGNRAYLAGRGELSGD